MPNFEAVPSRPEPVPPVLARLLWQGLALALLAIAVPAMFNSPASATLSFWLLAAPAAALLTLYRQVLATAWRARLVRATPRRRQLSRSAARAPRSPAAKSSRRPAGQAGIRRAALR
jgi:hypothetical protein